jgi:hypothetical protein
MKQTPFGSERVKIETGVGVHAQGRRGQVKGRPEDLREERNQPDGCGMRRVEGGLE